jgi:hypothetical protein
MKLEENLIYLSNLKELPLECENKLQPLYRSGIASVNFLCDQYNKIIKLYISICVNDANKKVNDANKKYCESVMDERKRL